jgi:hypothetical protein
MLGFSFTHFTTQLSRPADKSEEEKQQSQTEMFADY